MRSILTTLAVAVLFTAGTAHGGAGCLPLADADDGGCRPPTKDDYKCESKLAKEAVKLFTRIGTCHTTLAERPNVFDEEECEHRARDKFDRVADKLAEDCAACVAANAATLRDDVEQAADSLTGPIYCSGSQPFGGDDPGFVPESNLALACERQLERGARRIAKGFDACHKRAALDGLKGRVFDEEGCEDKVNALYEATLADFFAGHPHCPACVPSAAPQVETATGAFFDGTVLDLSYCVPVP